MKQEASETSAGFQQTTRHYIGENLTLYIHFYENLKLYIENSYFYLGHALEIFHIRVSSTGDWCLHF
jgi:hypothetical protein